MNNKKLALEDTNLEYFFVVCKLNIYGDESIEHQKEHLKKCSTYHFNEPALFTYGRVYAVTKVTKRGLFVMTNDYGKTNAYSPIGFERC